MPTAYKQRIYEFEDVENLGIEAGHSVPVVWALTFLIQREKEIKLMLKLMGNDSALKAFTRMMREVRTGEIE